MRMGSSCTGSPRSKMFDFSGPKVYYCAEPRDYCPIVQPRYEAFRRLLDPKEFASHYSRFEPLRVPHTTHRSLTCPLPPRHRIERAVAVVSNNNTRWSGTRLRNAFVTHALTDLYGSSRWSSYRSSWLGRRGFPSNYKGALLAGSKLQCMVNYKVGLCLENTYEPGYFSEKFVDTVRAGCIPVYRAHPSVSESILRGARWVDPQEFGDSVKKNVGIRIGTRCWRVSVGKLPLVVFGAGSCNAL